MAAPAQHTVTFGRKFTTVHTEGTLAHHWAATHEAVQQVTFNLQHTEWVAAEQITLLFAWVRHLHHQQPNRRIELLLPQPGMLPTDGKYILEERYRRRAYAKNNNTQTDAEIGEYIRKRRRDCAKNLLSKWQVLQLAQLNGVTVTGDTSLNTDYRINMAENYHRVIGFHALKVSDRLLDYDTFEQIARERMLPVFEGLGQDVTNLLAHYTTNTPFDNKSLSHIITYELFPIVFFGFYLPFYC